MKRSSANLSGLTAKKSEHSPSVTLFEIAESSSLTNGDYGLVSPRRSKRTKRVVEVKQDIEDIEEAVPGPSLTHDARNSDSDIKPPKKKRTRKAAEPSGSSSPRKKKSVKTELDTPHPAPAHWQETYEKIKEMRQMYVAPVDTMGCDTARFKETDPKSRRLSTLVSLMLSSQTKDEVTDAAVTKLRQALGGSITIEGLINADDNTISEAIAKVGFWRRKTQYIKQAMIRLRDDFDSDVPKTVDELCSLPGVGPKMAFLCLQSAWNINAGIGVDVHVHRISNLLGWHKPPTKTPEETRLNLQSWLPKEFHKEINHMLVGLGQTICLSVGPRCGDCLLSDGLCPSAKIRKVEKTRKALQLRTTSTFFEETGLKIKEELETEEVVKVEKEEIKLEASVKEEAEETLLNQQT